MRRLTFFMIALAVSPAQAQYPPPYGPYGPYWQPPVMQPLPPSPREKRAAREATVARVGKMARSLVETYGEPAVKALDSVSLPVAQQLAECHNRGAFPKAARPADILRVLANPDNGDDVALFVIRRIDELSDPAACDAFLAAPLDHALGLRDLAESARVRRRSLLPAAVASAVPDWIDNRVVVVALILAGIGGLLIWKRWQKA